MIGIQTPLRITPRGQLQAAQGEALLRQQIAAVLHTRAAWHNGPTQVQGERLMRPEFGCRLHHLLHQPLHDETLALMEALLIEDLQRSLPHVTLTQLHSELDEENASIRIAFVCSTAAGQAVTTSLHVAASGITLNSNPPAA